MMHLHVTFANLTNEQFDEVMSFLREAQKADNLQAEAHFSTERVKTSAIESAVGRIAEAIKPQSASKFGS